MGGTIRFITNQPDFETLEGSVEANLNTIEDGDMGGHFKGMINIPMNDRAALRVVGYGTEYGGWVDALREGGGISEDVNSGGRYGGRIALALQPTDSLTITPRVVFQKIETDGFNREEVYNLFANPYTTTRPPVQLAERQQYLRLDEAFEDETMIADLVVNWSLDAVDVTYAGSYVDREILASRDASALSGSVSVDLGFPESAVLLPSNLRDTTDLQQTTHELRFASNSDGAFNWVFGGFYSDVERTYAQRLPTPGYDVVTDQVLGAGTAEAVSNGYGPDSPYNSDLPYDIEQTALFGEVSYDVTERLNVTLGGRYYDFEEERRFTTGGLFSNGDDQVDSTSSDGFNPRLLVSYDVSDDMTVNAQASQGFRLGGVNDPLNVPLCDAGDLQTFGNFQSYEDETLWNYELGFKSEFERVRFNAAIFYTDIEDLQVTLDAGSCSSRISFNVPEAHTLGVEWELVAYPSELLMLTLSGSMLEAEFDSTVVDSEGNVLGGVEDGNRLASVPEFQVSASATYTFPVDAFGSDEMYVSAVLQHVGDRFTQPSDQVEGAGNFVSGLPFGGATGNEVTAVDLELDAYEQLNLSAGIIWSTFEAVVYVNNVTDENAELSFDRERGGRARLAFRNNQPRTVGITLRKFF